MSTLSPAEYSWSEVHGGTYAGLDLATGRDQTSCFWRLPTGRLISEEELEDMSRNNLEFLYGRNPFSALTGNGFIIDEFSSLKETKVTKPIKKPYNTLAVRFLRGPNLSKVYTYKVQKGAKVHLGQEVVVPSNYDGFTTNSVAVVVELHKTPQDTGPHNYLFVTGTVKPL